jgi:DNA-binding MarR family transcriptional regulator
MSREELIRAVIAETRANQVATDAVDQAVADYLELHRTDFRALDALEQRGRLTAGELAAAMHLTSGAVTSVIDRLERGGWAKRVADPDDRRRVLVEVTPKVQKLGSQFYDADDVSGFFDDYTEEQLELLLDFARRGRALNERRVARVQALSVDRKSVKHLRGRGRA